APPRARRSTSASTPSWPRTPRRRPCRRLRPPPRPPPAGTGRGASAPTEAVRLGSALAGQHLLQLAGQIGARRLHAAVEALDDLPVGRHQEFVEVPGDLPALLPRQSGEVPVERIRRRPLHRDLGEARQVRLLPHLPTL